MDIGSLGHFDNFWSHKSSQNVCRGILGRFLGRENVRKHSNSRNNRAVKVNMTKDGAHTLSRKGVDAANQGKQSLMLRPGASYFENTGIPEE